MTSKLDLYAALGGQPVIRTVVEEFYQRILADRTLRPFFAGVPVQRLIGHQTAFLCKVLQEKKHDGVAMRRAHFGRGIEDVHFDRVAQHLVETLRSMGASEALVGEVVARVGPLRHEVVEADGRGTDGRSDAAIA